MRSFPASRRRRNPRVTIFGIAAAVTAAAFAVVARASARRETADVDEAVHRNTAPDPSTGTRKLAGALAPIGKWYTYVPVAATVAGYLLVNKRDMHRPESWQRTRWNDDSGADAGAAAVLAASGAAYVLSRAFDAWLPQPPAPPGHEDPNKPVFPSGHAFGPAAVGLAAAYVLSREGHANAAVAVPIAAITPLVLAGGRLVDERHWASDIAGGYLAGLTVAAACVAGYELARD